MRGNGDEQPSRQRAHGNDREDALEAFGDDRRPERRGWQARRGVLLCHVMLRADVFQIRIEPNSVTASRDVGMNGATARKDAGGVVAGTGALGAFVEEHRTALANDAAAEPVAPPHHRPRARTPHRVSTPCRSRHARALGS